LGKCPPTNELYGKRKKTPGPRARYELKKREIEKRFKHSSPKKGGAAELEENLTKE